MAVGCPKMAVGYRMSGVAYTHNYKVTFCIIIIFVAIMAVSEVDHAVALTYPAVTMRFVGMVTVVNKLQESGGMAALWIQTVNLLLVTSRDTLQ